LIIEVESFFMGLHEKKSKELFSDVLGVLTSVSFRKNSGSSAKVQYKIIKTTPVYSLFIPPLLIKDQEKVYSISQCFCPR
jgi:hypothetical protein